MARLAILLSLLASRTVYAQGNDENTAVACQNATDDDGDGRVDCADRDCGLFVFCAGAGEPVSAPSGRVASGAFHLNALGLLTFGLMAGLELGGRHLGLLTRARFVQAGVANHFLYPDRDEGETLGFGLGASLGVRYYTAHRDWLSGFYIGGMGEWSHVTVDDPEESKTEVYRRASFGADLGYRWNLAGFLLGLGAIAGWSVPLSSEDRFDDGTTEERDDETTLFGMAVLELGFYFGSGG
jgi:hypothetical protein